LIKKEEEEEEKGLDWAGDIGFGSWLWKKREDIYRLKRCLMDFKTKNHYYLFPDLFDPWISRPLNWFTKWSIVLPSVELEFFLFVFLHLVLSIVIILVIFVVYSNLLNSLVSFMLLALFGHL
jgi:hypothetical protein